MGPRSEPQPDAVLIVTPQFGGRTSVESGYVRGTPELVLEVSDSTRHLDLGPKLADFARAGVSEYVVRAFDPDEVRWFRNVGGTLTRVAPDGDGLYRSTIFPGLWLDPAALVSEDLLRLRDVVELGTRSPEHAAFVATLAARRDSLRGGDAD